MTDETPAERMSEDVEAHMPLGFKDPADTAEDVEAHSAKFKAEPTDDVKDVEAHMTPKDRTGK